MNDVINRKDAIGAVLSVGHIAELSDGDAVIRVSAVNYVLRNLPSAQPVRKTGQWIKRKKGAIGYNCSCCGKSYISNHFDYCPNCGADMRGEQE